MKKLHPLLFSFFLVANFIAAQTPVQTLRGTVTDAANTRPLPGATVVLLGTTPQIGTITNESGSFRFEKLAVGRYRLQVSYVGYETVIIAEVLVEAGKEAVQDVQLQERGEALQEVVVKAQVHNSTDVHPVSVYTMTVEEQFRFPATFFDPARLAMSYPGVAGNNDGTNVISVRGNSPNAVKWRLEGVEIVNPNHTANAGTFSDRPTQAGGGVNILSAQLIGTSNFLAGAFPAEYGNSLGGIFDMQLRQGNDQKHEFTAQAGLVGIDLAAEGPILVGSGNYRASYLMNYRYSFTGLLTAMGADFGDEETAFQDLSFHFSLPTAKAGRFSVFGLGGKSSTVFNAPADSAEITEDKQRYNIDFQSKMGAVGFTHVLPLGKKSVLRTVAVLSGLEHQRTADLVANPPGKTRVENDVFTESKLVFSSIFSHKLNARHRLKAGLQASRETNDFSSVYQTRASLFFIGGNLDGWLWQPFFHWEFRLAPKWELTAGLHFSHFTYTLSSSSWEPRLALSFFPGNGKRLSVAYSLNSQTQVPQTYAFLFQPKRGQGLMKSHHLVASYRQEIGKSLIFNAETYFQSLFNVPVVFADNGTFSMLNLTDFSLSYLAGTIGPGLTVFSNDGKGRNYGLDVSLQKFIFDTYYFLLAGSLYRSEYATLNNVWRSTRFDGGHTLNLTSGREFSKLKKEKTVINGISSRVAWLGGFRDTPVDPEASAEAGYTVYDQQRAFTQKLDDYFRIDMRLYRKWNRKGRNSMLSLDIQNLTNRKNPQYHYFDSVQGRVLTKEQLGLIPILSWRMEF